MKINFVIGREVAISLNQTTCTEGEGKVDLDEHARVENAVECDSIYRRW